MNAEPPFEAAAETIATALGLARPHATRDFIRFHVRVACFTYADAKTERLTAMNREQFDTFTLRLEAAYKRNEELRTSLDYARFALVKFGDETMRLEDLATRADQARNALAAALAEFVRVESSFGHTGQHKPAECADCKRVLAANAALALVRL